MKTLTTIAVIMACAGAPVLAQDPDPVLEIELNGQNASDAGCLLTFVVRNGHAEQIDALVLETVLFDTAGAVDRLTLFDFGVLPAGSPRVRQFQVDGLACDTLGQVLINGASTCTVAGSDSVLCRTMDLGSRTGTELIG